MNAEEVILLGAGGGTRELIALVRHANFLPQQELCWNLRGILDDNPELAGVKVLDVPVLGALADASRFGQAKFILGIANPQNPSIRARIATRMNLPAARWASFIHPQAIVLDGAEVGPGAIIYPGATISSAVQFGAHSLAYFGAVVHHDSIVGTGCCLCAGVLVASSVRIGSGCYFGIGSRVREGVAIGDGALVGMGAAVVRDVLPGQVVGGVPARVLRDPL
jgi:sugar O-acyltransferase (sialic acid O-acetyltransferase NeuD family)